MIKVEKRLPFGFRGEWGKVYKLFVFDEENNEGVEYQKNSYAQIDSEVQFKYLENGVDRSVSTQPIMNLVTESLDRVVKTTDAYFDDKERRFKCVVGLHDIVFAFGCFWLVEKMDERSVFNPNKQTFYYCGLKQIDNVMKRRGGC